MTDKLDAGSNGGENKSAQMVTVNNLNYLLEPDLTVAVNSTYKKHFFTQNDYTPSKSANCILNSGADYLDFRRSYLSFELEITSSSKQNQLAPTLLQKTSSLFNSTAGACTQRQDPLIATNTPLFNDTGAFGAGSADDIGSRISKHETPRTQPHVLEGLDIGFGAGSAVNIINRITVQSRSGDEICRIENAAMLAHIVTNYCYGTDWNNSVGRQMGTNPKHPSTKNGESVEDYFRWKNVVFGSQTRTRFHIPLYVLTGFFNYDRLMPSMLCSGMRIQIDFNPARTVFVTNQEFLPEDISYSIRNLHLDMKSIQLTDSVQRYLNEVSATSGLEIVYADTNNTIHNINGQHDLTNHVEVRQACSRALRAFGRVRDNVAIASELRDSFAAEEWLCTSYQWRLGSLYFPQQPSIAYNKSHAKTNPHIIDSPSVEYTSWTGNATANDVAKGASYEPIVTEYSSRSFDNIREAYDQSLELFGKFSNKANETSVTMDHFIEGEIPLVRGTGGVGYSQIDYPILSSCLVSADILNNSGSYFSTGNTVAQTKADAAKNPIFAAGYFNSDIAFSRTNLPNSSYPYEKPANTIQVDPLVVTSSPITDLKLKTPKLTTYGEAWTPAALDSSLLMSVAQSKNRTSYGSYPGNHSIIPVNLERSTLFNLSGVPINNSRVLALNLEMSVRDNFGLVERQDLTVSGTGNQLNQASAMTSTYLPYPPQSKFEHKLDIFLQYVKLARVFLNNVEIEM